MTILAPETTAPAKKNKGLSRAVKAGAVITVGALLIGSAGSLAGWSQTVKNQDTNIQAGTLSIELTGSQSAFDVSDGAATAIPIDTASFLASPGDVIRVVEPMTITVDGDNLKAKLTGTSPGISGQLPVTVTTSLVDGTAGGKTDLTTATVVASTQTTNAVGAEAVVDLGSGANGAHAYTVIQDITVPASADISASGLGALVNGSSWSLSQYRGAVVAPPVVPVVPEVDLAAAWNIPDEVVAAGIRKSLGLPTGEEYMPWDPEYGTESEAEPLTMAHAAALTTLSLDGGAQSLAGLEKATNLTSLDSTFASGISDLSPLAGLTKLSTLWMHSTEITDISPLTSLVNLDRLYLNDNRGLVDIAPLTGLTQLRNLGVGGTGVTDLSPLAGMTNLTALRASSPGLTDLSGIASMTKLQGLELDGSSSLTDLTPLSELTKLTSLRLEGATTLTDLGPISGLTSLGALHLKGNTNLTSLAPLSGLVNLHNLSIWNTGVNDLAPLSGLDKLTTLDARGTSVSDWSPVAHVATVSK